ncbi:MAG: RecX family transcriptional regulator [Bacteroidales bacterium]|jgi:regulatory protein|nr:RecX family transcriptional regulator [Bacteroidales bacterium]MBQ5891023.1 RecX family transcriptional regulator [Bacteroidales bacterium]MEE1271311.1 regulatory protein RecX [Bacteroidales bacterium]
MTQQRLYTFSQGLQYAKDYCAKEERCQSQVIEKLTSLGLTKEESEDCVAELICEGYINEQRFAELFAVSKFHQNKWGKIKIAYYLRQKRVSEPCINKGLEAIDDEEYFSLIREIFSKKYFSISKEKKIKTKKSFDYLLGKGFAYNDIAEAIKEEDYDF